VESPVSSVSYYMEALFQMASCGSAGLVGQYLTVQLVGAAAASASLSLALDRIREDARPSLYLHMYICTLVFHINN
jgi:hypothetical protein